MTKVSAFLITLNEAENLPRCLRSLHSLVDEIVVVDSGSTDATVELAHDFGARVYEQPWLGFVGQKNFALSKTSQDWVFSIDADEEVSPELREEIESLKWHLKQRGASENVWGYAIPRRVYYHGRWILHGDWNPDYVTRLFYKPYGVFAGGEVHESVLVEGRVERLNGLLWHYTYRDETDHLARIEKYSTLWACSKFREGKRANALSPFWRSAFRFVRAAVLKRGFLDGTVGWRIARLSAHEVFLKYQKLRQLQRGATLPEP